MRHNYNQEQYNNADYLDKKTTNKITENEITVWKRFYVIRPGKKLGLFYSSCSLHVGAGP